MFKIEYLILEEEQKRISNLKKDMNWEIEGQICLFFNNKEIGFYEKEINIGDEYLSSWFQCLLETVKQLKEKNESFVSIAETTKVLHFVICDSKLEVIKGEMGIKRIGKGVGVYSPSDILKIYWKEDIDYGEFQKEVLDKAKQYIEEVSSYNKNFLETMDYGNLMHLMP